MYSSAYVWAKVLSHMEERLGSVTVSAWFDDAEVVELNENNLILYSPSDFRRDIIRRRCTGFVEDALKEVFNSDAKLLVFGDKERDSFRNKGKTVSSMDFNPQFTFDNFVVGNNNKYAHAAALAVAESPAEAYNPLFIYGGSGLGKTHLMQAIGIHIIKNDPESRVVYVSSETFTNELIKAISENKMRAFKNKYRKADVLLIDDIQFLENKDKTQEEFFHTFNALYEDEKQIVISSDRPPNQLVNLEERLRTRFAWNLIADITPADFETRVAILKKKAENAQLEWDDDLYEVCCLIAEKFTDNIRELEGAFNNITGYSNLLDEHIDVAFAKRTLRNIIKDSDGGIAPERIRSIVAKYYKIKVSDMDSTKRNKEIAYPRQVAMYLCRENTELSLPEIGELFGGKHHSTVIHSVNKITSQYDNDEETRKDIDTLKKKIKEHR